MDLRTLFFGGALAHHPRMAHRSFSGSVLTALALLSTSYAMAASAPSPLALSCTGCHQPSVNSPEMSALSALSPGAIEASLKAERDRPAAGSIMARFVMKMTDADIAQLAQEFGQTAKASRDTSAAAGAAAPRPQRPQRKSSGKTPRSP